jgi:protein-S-isoprenylcysteine O-methyltransferase Ste14
MHPMDLTANSLSLAQSINRIAMRRQAFGCLERAEKESTMEQKRRIIPPVYLLLTFIAMTGFHYLLPIGQFLPAPYSYGGIVLMVLGLSIAAAGSYAFQKAGTPVIPFEKSTALVTDGLNRFTRNPMYLGLVTLLIGTALFFGSIGSLIPIPFFIWIITVEFIRGEERFLQDIFGDDYLAYKRRVRRWL